MKKLLGLSPEKRFWRYVEKGEGCWLWIGSRQKKGYGVIGVRGTTVGAHRFSWEIATGVPAPRGYDICHACDNPSCVNPAHLFVGTRRMNIQDASRKGRLPSRVNGKHYNVKKTHCNHGHEYTAENTVWSHGKLGGERLCRQCRHRYYLNRKAKGYYDKYGEPGKARRKEIR